MCAPLRRRVNPLLVGGACESALSIRLWLQPVSQCWMLVSWFGQSNAGERTAVALVLWLW